MLEHAACHRDDARPVCLRVDSMLVAKQLNGEWRCKAKHLQTTYEMCLRYLGLLRARLGHARVRVDHVFREYNASADSLANEALDATQRGSSCIVVNRGWFA